MKKKMLFRNVFTTTLFCCILCTTACVNKIDNDIQEGNVPITFKAKASKASTKATASLFEKGDKAGLYAIVSGNDISGKRYIDNLELTSGDAGILIPSKPTFYPEGEESTLDFICYYPYQPQGISAGSASIPVSVQTDQSSHNGYSSSDFLVAKAYKIASSPNPIELVFNHKFTRIRVTLSPGKAEDIDQMLNANPRIIASGFQTKAKYNLQEDIFTDFEQTADIVTSGIWKKSEDNKLTGKEFIIIPQSINSEQTILMEWNGRIYSCPMPEISDVTENTQYEIDVTSVQTNSYTLNGVVGKIQEWPAEIIGEESDNKGKSTSLHVSVLSFEPSNVYRVYSGSTPIAEICKEYLTSEKLTSQAIVSYPIKKDETTDLSQGTVLQLLDTEEDINGGTICWNNVTNTFTYTPGTLSRINEVYYDESGKPFFCKPDTPFSINTIKHTIRDTRDGLQEYPIVKVGVQYWMRKNLCVTSYQDGRHITKQATLGAGAGYFKPDDHDLYFYNGEALENGELSPTGWKIPSEDDWNKLAEYIKEDASLLKAGEWQFAGTESGTGPVTPANNTTMFYLYPSGMWFKDYHANAYKMVGFWSWDYAENTIPDKTVFFMGQSNEIIKDQTVSSGKDYYKGLSIRCIKE